MRNAFRLLWLALLLGACFRPAPRGVPQVVVEGQAALDFGTVRVHPSPLPTRSVVLANRGTAPVNLLAFKADAPGRFTAPSLNVSLAPGERRSVDFQFDPDLPGTFQGAFTLLTDVTSDDAEPVRVTARGQAVSDFSCQFVPSDVLEFGNIPPGTSVEQEVRVLNTTGFAWEVEARGISGEGASAFRLVSEPGPHTVPAGGELRLRVRFEPPGVGELSAHLDLTSTADACGPGLGLHGSVAAMAVEASPSPLDFGGVDLAAPWGAVHRTLTLTNHAEYPVQLSASHSGVVCDGPWAGSDATCNPTAEFSLSADGSASTFSDLTLAPHSTHEIEVYFRPALPHAARGHLQFAVGLISQATLGVDLMGIGGVPIGDVSPTSIDFGQVASDSPKTRQVVVTNIASMPSPNPLQVVGLSILPGPGTAADEFLVDAASLALVPFGLDANQRMPISVLFNPNGTGPRSATLLVSTNDPTQGSFSVSLQGEGVILAPCSLSVAPASLDFGSVAPGQARDLSFRLTNTAGAACLLGDLDLTESSFGYALPGGPLASRTLAPGEALDVAVRFAPATASSGDWLGVVRFYLSDPAQPYRTVALRGTSQAGCLTPVPAEVDFGEVQAGCASPVRHLALYNGCAGPVHFASAALLPDRTGLCPGAGCAFDLVQAPAAGTEIQPGRTADLQVQYRPTAAGSDEAQLALTVQEPEPAGPVVLRGQATASAARDVVLHAAPEKVDVLMVIDDSASMSDQQSALRANLQAFASYAATGPFDLHLGVALGTFDTCGPGQPNPCGALDPTSPAPHFITSASPDLASDFMAQVPGATNASEEPIWNAYRALTPPLLDGWNAGFLREDARLEMVLITDWGAASAFALDLPNYLAALAGRRPGALHVSGAEVAGHAGPIAQLVTSVGGTLFDLASSAWTSGAANLGPAILRSPNAYRLPDAAAADQPFDVLVDGVVVPQVAPGGTPQWTYEAARNAIVFDDIAAPDASQTVELRYQAVCQAP